MAAVLYTGGLALNGFFGWPLPACIVLTGVFAGSWAIYGGLSSVAWTGAFTAVVKICRRFGRHGPGTARGQRRRQLVRWLWIVIERNRALRALAPGRAAACFALTSCGNSYNRLSVVQGRTIR